MIVQGRQGKQTIFAGGEQPVGRSPRRFACIVGMKLECSGDDSRQRHSWHGVRRTLPVMASVMVMLGVLVACGPTPPAEIAAPTSDSSQPPELPAVIETVVQFETPGSDPFIIGNAPYSARFMGGDALGDGSWTIAPGAVATVDFDVPAADVMLRVERMPATADWCRPPTATGSLEDPQHEAVFVRGNTRYNWESGDGTRFARGARGIEIARFRMEPGDKEFRIADASWTGTTNCGGPNAPTEIQLGSPAYLVCGQGTGNLRLSVDQEACYEFELDRQKPEYPRLVVRVADPRQIASEARDARQAGVPEIRFKDHRGNVRLAKSLAEVPVQAAAEVQTSGPVSLIELANGSPLGLRVLEVRYAIDRVETATPGEAGAQLASAPKSRD